MKKLVNVKTKIIVTDVTGVIMVIVCATMDQQQNDLTKMNIREKEDCRIDGKELASHRGKN